jgi:aryl-alcohol dehydrogenase-like predicted oxidoreductase
VWRDIEHELVPLARHAGLAILVWSPLAAGFLTGKYSGIGGGDDDRRRSFAFPPVDVDLGHQVLAELRASAVRRGATLAQVALAWLLAKPHVTSVIVGASARAQLVENLAAAEVALADDDIATLDQLSAPAPLYPGWWAAHFTDPFDP